MALTIYPAIDLKAGQVVRLSEGDMDRATIYADDPGGQAARFAALGATHLHVVDLDGAFAGESRNGAAVRDILKAFPGKVQVGGGIRTRAQAEAWFEAGVWRVVMGTAALEDPDLVKDLAKDHAITVAVDARDGMVAVRGWAERSTTSVLDLAKRFEDANVAALLFTDVGRDGLLKGVNIQATANLAQSVNIPVIASGGVAGMDDIINLRKYPQIQGVICGRAIYDGRLDLTQCL